MSIDLQMGFWPITEVVAPLPEPVEPDLASYDRFVVGFSGGKDSVACVLHLLEMGVDPNRIELHHHLVDGREGSELMDWPVTEAYCAAFARAFGLKLYFSWKVGGFEREMLRLEQRTAPVAFDSESGQVVVCGGDGGKLGTRRKFPQVSASLTTRWCSAYTKIDVLARVMTTESRFQSGKTLVVTGERAEESASRARYNMFEPDRTDNRDGRRVKRHVDHWRPVHRWAERQVWEILEQHRVRAHPAYYCGFGRCSCRSCIFGSPDQWATIARYYPAAFERIAQYEEQFGLTIHRRDSVRVRAARGTPYQADERYFQIAGQTAYTESSLVNGQWELPAGAFGEATGPT
ncbi:phosphoadenosine phosphosulfate reductase [Ralstonia insidiosa]|nr:phosphoadenosine phosphosulfate reductase [Ralstonia insidiosa]